jgi:multimeric flavodoxin WrbA
VKILLISSSPRKEKSQTFILAKEISKGLLQETAKSEIIHLDDVRVFFCKHCEECHKKILHCSIEDDVAVILKKMLEADGIILASPNYINQVTASMKALFERASHFIHCKRLLGKYIAGVVSSGSGNDKDVLDYIEFYARVCGAQYSGGVSSSVPITKEKMEEAFKLGNNFISNIKEKRAYPQQLRTIEEDKNNFKKIIQKRKDDWPEEYRYWQDKGWL